MEEPKKIVTSHIEQVDSHREPEIHQEKNEQSLIYQACLDLDAEAVERIAPNGNAEYLFRKIDAMTDIEALDIIRQGMEFHKDDWNFPKDMSEKLKLLLQGPEEFGVDKLTYSLELRIEAAMLRYASPYPEVRAIMDFEDDQDVPLETLRAYILGLVWTCVGAGVNTFFNSRFPGISISSSVVQVLAISTAKILECILPDWGFTLSGTRYSLNPGPYNFKEQMFTTIIFSAGMSSFQAYSMIMVQHLDVYYGHKWVSFGYQILVTLFFQFMGIGLAGIFRRIAVYPSKAIWPGSLFTIAMNRALLSPEPKEKIHGWTISRFKFFFVAFGGMFFYYWLPGYLFTAMSSFNWMTWIAPNNYHLNVITGGSSGLGFGNPITTLDWNQATAAFPALTNPFFNIFHRFLGTLIGIFIIMGLFYSNWRWTGYLPPNSSSLFANDGELYNVSRVTHPGESKLDEKLYQKYSPPFLSAGKLVQAGASFVVYPLYFIYVTYDQWPMIRDGFVDLYKSLFKRKGAYEGYDDPHTRMMSKYPEAPDWWFLVIFAITIAIAIVCLKVYPMETPVWFLFVIVGLSIVFMPPLLLLQATTGTNFGLLYLMIIVAGYCLPGNANAQMLASLLGGWSIDGTTDSYVSLQKMAHYSGVAPRAVFRGQLLATLATSFVAVGVEDWQMSSIPGLCTVDQPNKFTCAAGAVATYSSSVVYGLIGPKRVFAGLYPIMKYCFLMGFLIGVVFCGACWLGDRYGPRIKLYCQEKYSAKTYDTLEWFVFIPCHYIRWFNPVLVLVGMQDLCPISMAQCWPGFFLCWLTQSYIRDKFLAWWQKYNYVLAAALYAGVAFSALIIYFSLQFKPKDLVWWGNSVNSNTLDGQGVTGYMKLPEKGYFGPPPG